MLRLPRSAILFAGLLAILAGCGFFDDSAIPYKSIPASATRLIFAAPALREATVRFRVAEMIEAGKRIEHGRWDGLRGERAELMLTEALTEAGITAPEDPRALTARFPGLVRLKASFSELYESDTAVGPALWRRFVAGDSSCVIFRQHWDNGSGTAAIRVLSGYYCAPPGGVFTVQDAAATLHTVSVKPR